MHIPGLNQSGWHDAGDYDLAAGSQAGTTFILALAREAFGINTDQTTVRKAKREVLLHTPDGVPDIVQQVGHGADNLLSGYRADWSYIPGQVVSGTALIRPDLPELKDNFPFLWQQAENVIGGAASYIFTVLAADQLLNGNP